MADSIRYEKRPTPSSYDVYDGDRYIGRVWKREYRLPVYATGGHRYVVGYQTRTTWNAETVSGNRMEYAGNTRQQATDALVRLVG